ncbi:Endonuclease/exonuclease/phosphatase [Syncephalastrum racemosum]|uniref:sphingomyelin phosphodiesterase n=1 Tax=Syncephalastrum racemosum TaxID=13706 RepID=A0A1X2HQ12_SYNRA|nr:Endonuclease/exonuclease/phosphatase [Syncephalastrum racemosum]
MSNSISDYREAFTEPYRDNPNDVEAGQARTGLSEDGNGYDSDDTTASEVSVNEQNRSRGRGRGRGRLLPRGYSQESVVSTDSAPPPYELYPPAKTFLGRAYNWLRQIPRFRPHQAIYLPTISIRRSRSRAPTTDSLSSSSIDSFASSAYPSTCCSYYYFYLLSKCPSLPRFTLPPWVARFRACLICLSFLCLVLFSILLFFSVYFSPASVSPPVVPDKITDTYARLLTLNIFMRPPGVTNNWSDYKNERLDYIIQYILPQYDIIAFQESFAFASRRKDKLIQEARNLGFNHHVESPRRYPWDFGVDGGLLILSRFNIRESNIIQYPRGIHSDWLSHKGALHALIDLNATHSMHLYTTHTQASYETPPIPDDVAIRISQFAQFHQFIRDTARDDSYPVVLMGDFNVDAAVHGDDIFEPSSESSEEYQMMLDVLSGKGLENADGFVSQNAYKDDWQIELVDAVYDTYNHHPVTFGDIIKDAHGRPQPAETVLTDIHQVMTAKSIDRILWDPSRPSLRVENAQVEPFFVRSNDRLTEEERQQIAFTQVSADHYGLSCTARLL